MEIRQAVESDFGQVLPLLTELLRRTLENNQENRDNFTRALKSDKRAVYVADQDGKIVGLVTLTVYQKDAFYANSRKAEIDEFIVSDSVRGSGVAGRLIERAIEHASERGCEFVELWSRLENERAHSFYKKYGLSKLGFFLQKKMT